MLKLSDIDALIVRYADSMSPAQIAFKLQGAMSPEQVMVRIGQLLDSPDWLTNAQQDQLVTLKMRQLVVELEEMPRTTRNAEVLLRGLEAVGDRLDKRRAATEEDLSQLYAFQGTVMVDAIEKALAHMRGALTGANKISALEWDTALAQAMLFAQMEVAKHESGASAADVVEVKAVVKPVSGNQKARDD